MAESAVSEQLLVKEPVTLGQSLWVVSDFQQVLCKVSEPLRNPQLLQNGHSHPDLDVLG